MKAVQNFHRKLCILSNCRELWFLYSSFPYFKLSTFHFSISQSISRFYMHYLKHHLPNQIFPNTLDFNSYKSHPAEDIWELKFVTSGRHQDRKRINGYHTNICTVVKLFVVLLVPYIWVSSAWEKKCWNIAKLKIFRQFFDKV